MHETSADAGATVELLQLIDGTKLTQQEKKDLVEFLRPLVEAASIKKFDRQCTQGMEGQCVVLYVINSYGTYRVMLGAAYPTLKASSRALSGTIRTRRAQFFPTRRVIW